MSIHRTEQFKKALGEDDKLKEVIYCYKEGWPDKKKILGNLRKYYNLQNAFLLKIYCF